MHNWIKLHKQIIESEIYKDPTAFRVFLHLLLIADRNGRGTYTQRQLAHSLGIPSSTLQSSCGRCVSMGILSCASSCGKYTRFSILNWNKYQSIGEQSVVKPSLNHRAPFSGGNNEREENKKRENFSSVRKTPNLPAQSWSGGSDLLRGALRTEGLLHD